jgi:Fe-S cluster assembly protein SufD
MAPTATVPSWLAAWAESVGLPTGSDPRHRSELWKYVDFAPLDRAFDTHTSGAIAQNAYEKDETFRVVGHWHNGTWEATPALGVQAGVVDARKLPSAVALGSKGNLFSEVADRASDTALVVTVAPGLQVDTPLAIGFSANGLENTAAAQRVHVHVGKGASVRILVEHQATQSDRVLFNRMTTIHLEPDSQLEWVVIPDTSGILRAEATCLLLEAHSHLKFFSVHTQTPFEFHDTQVYFRGENAHAELNGLGLLADQDKLYQHVEVHHDVPNTQSFQLYKSILAGHSTSEYTGLVKVAPHAQKTLSGQLNRNLMLSGTPQAHSRPQLQIYADDVKCNHGATVGQLDPQELFYMVSRGLSPEAATGLLTQGFADEVAALISDMPVRDTVRRYADAYLRACRV